MSDAELLEPSIDPKTRKISYRHLTARNEGGSKTVVKVRDTPEITIDEPAERGGTNTGATPVENVLAGLCGCDAVITHSVAQIIGFDYSGIDYECEAIIDPRGSRGVSGVRPYFETVNFTIRVRSNESPEKFAKLRKNVEHRCPVSNLIRDAGVEFNVDAQMVPDA